MEPHWGPRIDKIPIKGWIGAVITIGMMVCIMAGVPQSRLWLFIAVPLGLSSPRFSTSRSHPDTRWATPSCFVWKYSTENLLALR